MSFTYQETFDLAARHLLDQGFPALTLIDTSFSHHFGIWRGHDVQYYYRKDIWRSPVGALMQDHEYEPWMEGATIRKLLEKGQVFLRINWQNLPLVEELERIHDEVDCKEWRWELAKVAAQFGLNTHMIDNI